MSACIFEPTEEAGEWNCPDCHRKTPAGRHYAVPPRRTCFAKTPSFAERARDFMSEVSKWEQAGRPERSSEDQHALDEICRGCSYYKPDPLLPIVMGGGQCGACGCGLKPERKLFNALRFGTYKCKQGKWDAAIAAGVMYVEPPKVDKRDPDPDDGRSA